MCELVSQGYTSKGQAFVDVMHLQPALHGRAGRAAVVTMPDGLALGRYRALLAKHSHKEGALLPVIKKRSGFISPSTASVHTVHSRHLWMLGCAMLLSAA
jgi:hypothetical protein